MTKKRGRPEFEPTADQRTFVRMMAACGLPQEDMRMAITNPQTGKPISLDTLEKHFRADLDEGGAQVKAQVMAAHVSQCLGRPAQYDEHGNEIRAEIKPNAGAQHFFLKCRAGWRETMVNEITGKDGGPIETKDVTGIVAEEIADQFAEPSVGTDDGDPVVH